MLFVAVMLVTPTVSAEGTEPKLRQLPGLTVVDGQLLRHGKPYRGIGANYTSLFGRTLKDPTDTSYRKQLARLSQAGIPFVRFRACGFWPVDWDLYQKDREAYFQLLDGVVKIAEENEIGLIPSLFWYMATIPDLVGEPIDQLGNPDSKTISFIRQYTKEVVLRYKSSPAIWGWEFGNEYNLVADLPNASAHLPPVWPTLKTALERTERDELTSKAMLSAFDAFAKVVRAHDKHRILITGNSIPRASAFHNLSEKSWTQDSPQEFEGILSRDNPDPFQMLSVHVYPKTSQYPGGAKDFPDLVKTMQEMSLKAKKPLFIGEFGSSPELDENEERANFLEILNAIEVNKVPLSAFWVFDFSLQDETYNVTFDNQRSYMLKLIAESNRRK